MKKTILPVIFVGILAAYAAHAANGHGLEIDCKDPKASDPNQVVLWIDVDSNDEVSLSDGAELGGDYKADPKEDSKSYKAFKLVPRDEDGEQPSEIKIAKNLLTGAHKRGAVWLAPGIQGGTFGCASTLSEE